MTAKKVFIDTNVFKFSSTRLLRFSPRNISLRWGNGHIESTVYDPVYINPNDGLTNNPGLQTEAGLLPQVAALGNDGRASFVVNVETKIELAGLPSLDSETGRFYGAAVATVEAPISYGRIVFSADSDYREEQFRFLCSIKDQRFSRLQRITGAYQGQKAPNRNQLLDAFHLWCAEYNKCDFFLTLDLKLAKARTRFQAELEIPVVKPSELLQAFT